MDLQIGNRQGVAAVKGKNINGGDDIQTGFKNSQSSGAFLTSADMRTRLAAINGSYYTSARLNQMSDNDMVYALRVNDDPTTVK